jgi:hypothetical protein
VYVSSEFGIWEGSRDVDTDVVVSRSSTYTINCMDHVVLITVVIVMTVTNTFGGAREVEFVLRRCLGTHGVS